MRTTPGVKYMQVGLCWVPEPRHISSQNLMGQLKYAECLDRLGSAGARLYASDLVTEVQRRLEKCGEIEAAKGAVYAKSVDLLSVKASG